jgi:hypothetical protein
LVFSQLVTLINNFDSFKNTALYLNIQMLKQLMTSKICQTAYNNVDSFWLNLKGVWLDYELKVSEE